MDWLVTAGLDVTGITTRPRAYGHRLWAEIATSVGPISGEFLLVRFDEAVAVAAGAPAAITYDATRGLWTAEITYAAGIAFSFAGITVANGYAQGDYGYIQVKGPNCYTMTSAAAMTAGLGVQHSAAADNKVKEVAAATTADYMKTFGYLLKAQGGAGTIGVGELALCKGF
jgi:hypothetical protein